MRISAADVAEAQQRVDAARNQYYLDRHRELRKANLHQAAALVGTAFAGRASLSDDELDEALRRAPADPDATTAARAQKSQLQRLGYIWQAGVIQDEHKAL